MMRVNDSGAIMCRAFRVLKEQSRQCFADASGMWSYPALLQGRDGGVLWLSLILGTSYIRGKQRTALFRPKAVVLAKCGTADIVRFESFREGHDPFPSLGWRSPVAVFPHKAVGGVSVSGFGKLEDELLAGYKTASDVFACGKPLPARFRELYLQMQHPVFLGYLNRLVPGFVSALEVPGGAD